MLGPALGALCLFGPVFCCQGFDDEERDPRLRIAPEFHRKLLASAPQTPGGRTDRVHIVLRARSREALAPLRAALHDAHATDVREWSEILRIEATVPRTAVETIAGRDGCSWIEERPTQDRDRDEANGVRAGIGVNRLDEVPGRATGRGVKIGIWEAGHPDTVTRTGAFPGHDDLAGRVLILEDSQPTRHATAIASVVAGNGHASAAAGGGPRQWRGIAPEAYTAYYSTSDSDSEAAELIDSVRRESIHLSLQPWGEQVGRDECGLFGDYTIRAAEFDGAISGDDPARAGEGRVPVIFSVGNYQVNLECPVAGGGIAGGLFPGFRTVNPPHTAKNIISVGAVYSDDLSMTTFSSWGPVDDGRIKPDFVAPGSQRGGDGGVTAAALDPPDGYRTDEGTSYAAASVAGLLGILMGERTAEGLPSLDPAAWKAILIVSARDLSQDPLSGPPTEPNPFPPEVGPYRGPDFFHGFGLVSAPAAMAIALDPRSVSSGVSAEGERLTFRLARSPENPKPLRVALVWDDPPGDPAAERALVNDLDLAVREVFVGGITRVLSPWVLDPARPADRAERGSDRLNNAELVESDIPLSGDLSVVVSGHSMKQGPQKFWLAVSEGYKILTETTPRFQHGDSNGDGLLDLTDAISTLDYLFFAGFLPCHAAADTNADEILDITDSIRTLVYLFLGGLASDGPPLGGGCEDHPERLSLGCADDVVCR